MAGRAATVIAVTALLVLGSTTAAGVGLPPRPSPNADPVTEGASRATDPGTVRGERATAVGSRRSRSLGDRIWNRTYGGPSDDANAQLPTVDGGSLVVGRAFDREDGAQAYALKTGPQGLSKWRRRYGGDGNETARAVAPAHDGGFLLVGTTRSYGTGVDVWLLKVGPGGAEEWNRSYGSDGNETASDVVRTSDGFGIVGTTGSVAPGRDVYLLRVNRTGHRLWNRTYGGPSDDTGASLAATSGGFLLAGSTRPNGSDRDALVTAVNASGVERWNATYGGDRNERAVATAATKWGFSLVGYANGSAGTVGWGAGLNSRGVERWNRTYPMLARALDVADAGDGIAVAGYGSASETGRDGRFLRVTPAGRVLSNRSYGTPSDDRFDAVSRLASGAYLLAGVLASSGRRNTRVVKVAGSERYVADTEWVRAYGGGNESFEAAASAGEGYVFAGGTTTYAGVVNGSRSHDAWVVATTGDGRERWNRSYGGPGYDVADDVVASGNGYVFAGVNAFPSNGSRAVWVMGVGSGGTKRWEYTRNITPLVLHDGPEVSIARASDGTLFVGTTFSKAYENTEGWVAKLGADGAERWNRQVGIHVSDSVADVVATGDGGAAVAGTVYDWPKETQAWIQKLDAEGDKRWRWRTRYGGARHDSATGIVRLDDGFSFAGETTSFASNREGEDLSRNAWIHRLDGEHRQRWWRVFGSNRLAGASSIAKTDRGFVIGGHVWDDGKRIWLLGVTDDGVLRWETTVSSPRGAFGGDALRSASTDGSGVVFAGIRGTGTNIRNGIGGEIRGGVSRYYTLPSRRVGVNQTLTVDVFLENTGSQRTTETVTLYVDNDSVDDRTVTLGPQGSSRVFFTTRFDRTGDHSVRIDGLANTGIRVTGHDVPTLPDGNTDPEGPAGDVTGDGVVSSGDATMILRFIVGLPTEFFDHDAADVTGDGAITSGDATRILRLVVGLD